MIKIMIKMQTIAKTALLSAVLVLSICACALVACNKKDDDKMVTFKAYGEEDITIRAIGGRVDPPAVPEKAGNVGHWDRSDFDNITEDMTVNAIYETQGLQYTLIAGKNEYEVSQGKLSEETKELYIPAEHEGIPVTKIADNGFKNDSLKISYEARFTAVHFSEGLKVIGVCAFQRVNIDEVFLPEGLTEIQASAFSLNKTIKSIALPDSVKVLGSNAFGACNNLVNMSLPSELTEIPASCFQYCKSLVTIGLPASVDKIGESAFSQCTSLAEIRIPEKVTEIPRLCFCKCSALVSINLPDNLTLINESAFQQCTSLISINLPETTRDIAYRSFEECSSLVEINIPANTYHIGASAFKNCTNLKKANLSQESKLDSLSNEIFSGCSSLQSFEFTPNIIIVNANVFDGCTDLDTIVIPANVIDMGYEAFKGWEEHQTIIVKGDMSQKRWWSGNWLKSCNARVIYEP